MVSVHSSKWKRAKRYLVENIWKSIGLFVLTVIAGLAFIFAILAYTGSGGAESDKIHFDVGKGLVLSPDNVISLAPISAGQFLGNPVSSAMGPQVPKGVGAFTQGSLMSAGPPASPFHEIMMQGQGRLFSSLDGVTPGWSEPLSGAMYQIDPTSAFFDPIPVGIFAPMLADRVYVSFKPSFVDMGATQLIRRVELMMRVVINTPGAMPVSSISIDPAALLPPNTQVTSPTATVPISTVTSISITDALGSPVLGLETAASLVYSPGASPQFLLGVEGAGVNLVVGWVLTLNMVADIPFESIFLGP
jgi:hypothetical protein